MVTVTGPAGVGKVVGVVNMFVNPLCVGPPGTLLKSTFNKSIAASTLVSDNANPAATTRWNFVQVFMLFLLDVPGFAGWCFLKLFRPSANEHSFPCRIMVRI